MRIKLKRGNTLSVSNYVGPSGELVINTDSLIPHLQDGVTPGGINLEGVNYNLDAPNIIAPIPVSYNVSLSPILQTEPYSGFGTHKATYWEIGTAPGLPIKTYVSNRDTVNLTSINLAEQNVTLNQLTSYYVRVRFENERGILSKWSPTVKFTTAQILNELTSSTLVDLQGQESDYFGYTTAFSSDGTLLAIAAIGSGTGSTGTVSIYRKEIQSWVIQQTIVPENVSESYSFGFDISMAQNGNVLVISSILEDKIYIYKNINNVFILHSTLTPSSLPMYGKYGNSVTVSGDGSTIVVGIGTGNSNDDKVYVYRLENELWIEEAILSPNITDVNSKFGCSIRISNDGNTLVIGASGLSTAQGIESGAAFIYTREVDVWSQKKILMPDFSSNRANFGHDVSISGDGQTVAVGGINYTGSTDSGAVIIYRFNGINWIKDNVLVPPLVMSGDKFGSVTLTDSGNILVVGASGDSVEVNKGGAIYIYTTVNGVWTFHSKKTPINPTEQSGYGTMVRISGNGKAIVTSSYNQTINNLSGVGRVHVYS